MPSSSTGTTPAPKAQAKKRDRLERIVAGSARLFRERGYESTSINDLADELEMSVGGLYRYITTKADLLVMVCEDIYGDLPEVLAAVAAEATAPRERLRNVVRTFLESCVTNRALILLMYREYRHLPDDAKVRFIDRERNIAELVEASITQAVAAKEFDAPDPWLLARNIVLLGHLPALKPWEVREGGRTHADVVNSQLALLDLA